MGCRCTYIREGSCIGYVRLFFQTPMSNQLSTSAQSITLPKSGEAIAGIGETFSPDIFTRIGNFTVPIAILPGRNSFYPQLNLQYSTGNANDIFGLGWPLSIRGVARKTSDGTSRYQDETNYLPTRSLMVQLAPVLSAQVTAYILQRYSSLRK